MKRVRGKRLRATSPSNYTENSPSSFSFTSLSSIRLLEKHLSLVLNTAEKHSRECHQDHEHVILFKYFFSSAG